MSVVLRVLVPDRLALRPADRTPIWVYGVGISSRLTPPRRLSAMEPESGEDVVGDPDIEKLVTLVVDPVEHLGPEVEINDPATFYGFIILR